MNWVHDVERRTLYLGTTVGLYLLDSRSVTLVLEFIRVHSWKWIFFSAY